MFAYANHKIACKFVHWSCIVRAEKTCYYEEDSMTFGQDLKSRHCEFGEWNDNGIWQESSEILVWIDFGIWLSWSMKNSTQIDMVASRISIGK